MCGCYNSFMQISNDLLARLDDYPWALGALQSVALLLAVYLINLLTQSLLVRALERGMRGIPGEWSKALLNQRVIARLAHVIPALVVYYGVGLLSGLPESVAVVIRSVASAYVVLTIAWAIGNLLNAVGEIYVQRDPARAQARPIKGYLQVLKILAYLITAILIIAVLFNRDPLLLLSGLGAMTST